MLSYKIYGKDNKTEIVLLHGLGGSHTIFYKQIEFLQKKFKIIALDLPCHGESKHILANETLTFEKCSHLIIETLNSLNIKKAHFIGVSLGTLIAQDLLNRYPEYIKSVIMAGAIVRFNLISKTLIFIGHLTKHILPYMFLYKTFAYVIMPRNNHRKSRKLFSKEAQRMG